MVCAGDCECDGEREGRLDGRLSQGIRGSVKDVKQARLLKRSGGEWWTVIGF